jgi:hypothetical protein
MKNGIEVLELLAILVAGTTASASALPGREAMPMDGGHPLVAMQARDAGMATPSVVAAGSRDGGMNAPSVASVATRDGGMNTPSSHLGAAALANR